MTIVYDTMWDGTKKMAEAIAKGIHQTDGTVTIKLFNAERAIKRHSDRNLQAKAVLFGSPT